jgi:hypothetical protein
MERRYLIRFLPLSLLDSFLKTICAAERFWVKKPWAKWNLSEARSILVDSPWARAVYEDPYAVPDHTVLNILGYRRRFVVIWSSAKIVRLARERRSQIMGAKTYKPEVTLGLATTYYVLEVRDERIMGVRPNPAFEELAHALFAQLSPSCSLTTTTKRLRLAGYVQASERRGGLFLFERRSPTREPFLECADDKVTFETILPAGGKLLAEFRLGQMLFDGALDL